MIVLDSQELTQPCCYPVTLLLVLSSTCSLPREGQDRIPGVCVPNQFLAACYNEWNGAAEGGVGLQWACTGQCLSHVSHLIQTEWDDCLPTLSST